jgi:hypothetical protein
MVLSPESYRTQAGCWCGRFGSATVCEFGTVGQRNATGPSDRTQTLDLEEGAKR